MQVLGNVDPRHWVDYQCNASIENYYGTISTCVCAGSLSTGNELEKCLCIYAYLPLELAVYICKWASTMILLFDVWTENVAYHDGEIEPSKWSVLLVDHPGL